MLLFTGLKTPTSTHPYYAGWCKGDKLTWFLNLKIIFLALPRFSLERRCNGHSRHDPLQEIWDKEEITLKGRTE